MSGATGTTPPTTPASTKGSPGLIILLVVVLAPSLLLGQLAGAGGASIIGGFVALFSLLAVMGGTLVADLRRMAVLGPLIALSAVTPRLVADLSVPLSFALVVLLIFVGGLLPIRGRRYDGVALGLGMGTLFGYAMPLTGTVQPAQLVLSALVGLGVAVLLRVVMGLADPRGATRTAVAGLFDDPNADVAATFDAWASDRPQRWLGTVLVAAAQYRLARRVLSHQTGGGDLGAAEVLRRAEARAGSVAAGVRGKRATATGPDAGSADATQGVDDGGPTDSAADAAGVAAGPASESATAAITTALDAAEQAAVDRDTTPVPVPSRFRSWLSQSAVRASLRHGSTQVRHAIRTALAVLLALLVSLLLTPGDPLLPTLLMTTFGLVQLSWRGTLSKARDRLIGLLVGGVIVVVVVGFLPAVVLLPISLVGLGVGMWFITARPAVGAAGILVMSVGINTELRHLDPGHVIVEYVLLTLVALLIGGVLGFVVVPGWRPPALAARIGAAAARCVAALSVLARSQTGSATEATLQVMGEAQAAVQQLVPDREKLSEDQQQLLGDLQSSLQDLLAMALFTAMSAGPADRPVLDAAAAILSGEGGDARESTVDEDPWGAAVVAGAREVAERRRQLEQSLRPAG